jgi:diguanylate cyclase (GGDEF)-like protein
MGAALIWREGPDMNVAVSPAFDVVSVNLLQTLLPLHIVVSDDGVIIQAGAALSKISGDGSLVGELFDDVFEVIKPAGMQGRRALLATVGSAVHLRFKKPPYTRLKGVVAVDHRGGLTVTLSFGIGVVDAVQRFGPTSCDFAPNDPTIEMLHVVEAKSAAMNESRELNDRLQHAKLSAEHDAQTDPLTGLYNRRALIQVLESAISAARKFTFIHMDLDYFKAVNDGFGHAAGDAVLSVAAGVMQSHFRGSDCIARTGGDEFVAVMMDTTDGNTVKKLCERLITAIEVPIEVDNNSAAISGSIGFTCSSQYDAPQIGRMMNDADYALYASKRGGRGRVTQFEGLSDGATKKNGGPR